MKSIVKFVVTLGLISAITGGALAVVYNITKPIIAAQDLKTLNEGLSKVFAGDYKFEKLDKPLQSIDPNLTIGDCFLVKNASGLVDGIVITVNSPGSQGLITMLVGVKKDGTISGVSILSLSETPGLGANADNPTYYVNKSTKTTFLQQFIGKSFKDAFTVKQDVIPLTAATITSKAVSLGVKIALDIGHSYLEEAGK